MKLPKIVQIAGINHTIKMDNRTDGGNFDTAKQRIVVGVKSKKPDRIFNIFIHEIAEVATVERRIRYDNSNNELRFIMSHQEFENIMGDVAAALFPLIREKR